MTKYKFLSIGFFTVFLISFLSCNGGKKTGKDSQETEVIPEDIVELRDDQVKVAGIELGTIDSVYLSSRLEVNGSVIVSAKDLATVCMPLGGFVKSTTLMPGSTVSKGQTLAVLENLEFINIQQNYLETKIRYEYAEAEYIRHSELYIDEVYSQNNVQQVTSDFKSLKAQLKSLGQKLNLIGINPAELHEDDISSTVALISPISGYVKTVNVNIGKFVSPSDILFEIINSDKLLLELNLFEKDASKVSAGQKIQFFINNESEQHEAVIYETGKSINADRTCKVYANVPGTCKNVLPGMYVNAIIETAGSWCTALPSDAIVSFDDKDYIFIFDRNKEENGKPFSEYRMIEVQKGLIDSGFTGIILPPGLEIKTVRIVKKGAYNLLSAKKNAGEMSC
jgi:RND family efflux transporter MFP subunit